MIRTPEPVPDTITATVKLNLAGAPVQAEITVPTQSVPLPVMLPVLRSFAETVIAEAVRAESSRGLTVSCRSGCGACCRQLVPITEPEARRIGEVIDDLPEPRQSTVRHRFAEARHRLEAAGLLDTLNHPETLSGDQVNEFGLKYFAQGIPCPFLEDESCSIYAERPIACREYLVTSPRENCAQPTAGTVRRVELAAKVSTVLGRMDDDSGTPTYRWVALILAPEWAKAHDEQAASKPGPEWLRQFFSLLTGKSVAAPPAPGSGERPSLGP